MPIVVSYTQSFISQSYPYSETEKYLAAVGERFNFCLQTFGSLGAEWYYSVSVRQRDFIFKNECDAVLFKLKFG